MGHLRSTLILLALLAGAAAAESLPTISDIEPGLFPVEPARGAAISGRDYYVALTGADANAGTQQAPFRHITHALSVARAGDRVRVYEGTYEEGTDDEYRGLVIEQDDLILESMPGAAVTVRPKTPAQHTYGMELRGDRLMVRGIRVEGFPTSGIGLGREGETQRDIVLADVEVVAPAYGNRDGIVSYADNRNQGIPALDGLLLRNVVVRGANLGISCNAGPCTNWRLEGVRVLNAMEAEGSGADAIAVEEGSHILLQNVEVSGAAADGVDLKAERVALFDVWVHGVARNGIKLWRGGDVVNALVEHTGADAAIVFAHGARYRLLNTLVAYHNWRIGESYAMTVAYDVPEEPGQVEIANCVFYRNAGGVFISPAFEVSIDNSVFADIENDQAIAEVTSRTTGERLTIYVEDDTAVFVQHDLGAGNLLGIDPHFADPADGDFTLVAESPLIDAGTVLEPFPEVDLQGAPRVQGEAPDIGPLEHPGTGNGTQVAPASWGRVKGRPLPR